MLSELLKARLFSWRVLPSSCVGAFDVRRGAAAFALVLFAIGGLIEGAPAVHADKRTIVWEVRRSKEKMMKG